MPFYYPRQTPHNRARGHNSSSAHQTNKPLNVHKVCVPINPHQHAIIQFNLPRLPPACATPDVYDLSSNTPANVSLLMGRRAPLFCLSTWPHGKFVVGPSFSTRVGGIARDFLENNMTSATSRCILFPAKVTVSLFQNVMDCQVFPHLWCFI